jgi:hypothetical protein
MNFSVAKKTIFTLILANALGSVTCLDSVAMAQPPVDVTFKIGDLIEVVSTTDCVSIRSIASTTGSSIFKCEPAGAKGMIVGNPLVDINGSSTVTFYQVTFSDGISGWAAGKYLTKSTVIIIPPPVVNPCDSAFQRGLISGVSSIDTLAYLTRGYNTGYTAGFASGKASVICPPIDSLGVAIKKALSPFLK